MQVFLARVGTQGLVILAVTMLGLGFPYSPANVGLTLLTVGVPTLFLTAWARPTAPDPQLLANLGRFVVPAAVLTAAAGVGGVRLPLHVPVRGAEQGRRPGRVLAAFERYTGLSSDDVGFAEAAATIGAQTALSTFVSYAAFLLILFLKPPSRFFAAWTRPDGDRRPAVLVVVLVVVFSGLLFVPWFTDYFGLTHAADPVFRTVLPALVLWFALLSWAYRSRVLERALGLPRLLTVSWRRAVTWQPLRDGHDEHDHRPGPARTAGPPCRCDRWAGHPRHRPALDPDRGHAPARPHAEPSTTGGTCRSTSTRGG